MKKIMLLLAFALAANISVFAQQGGPGRSVEERVKMTIERLTKELQLTKEQQVKLDTVFSESFKAMQKMREDAQASGNRPDRAAFEKLNNERNEKVKGILSEEQYKKYQESQAAMRQRGGNRGGGGGNGGARGGGR